MWGNRDGIRVCALALVVLFGGSPATAQADPVVIVDGSIFYGPYLLPQAGHCIADETGVAFGLNPRDVFGRLALALLAILDEDRTQAHTILRELARHRAERGSRDGEITYKQAQLFALAGDSDAALTELARALDDGFFCAPCFAQDPIWAPLAADPRMRRIVARATARHEAFGRRFGLPESPSQTVPQPRHTLE